MRCNFAFVCAWAVFLVSANMGHAQFGQDGLFRPLPPNQRLESLDRGMKEMQEELDRIEKLVRSLGKRGVKSYSISATCLMTHNDFFYVASLSGFVLTSAEGGSWTYPQVDLKVGDVITVSATEDCSYMNDASKNMIATTSATGGYVDYTPAPSDDPEKMKHWFTLQAQ